jgi:pimeloyl-ACP methyl ester carboxylesterase
MSGISYANLEQIKLCYKSKGEGYPVILIHGFAKKEFWIGQINTLSKQFKVFWFDNRGVGCSDRPNIPYTMAILVEDLKGLLDFLDIQSAHLIGHSLGSFIAQNFALKYPKMVGKLILLSTSAGLPDKKGVAIFKDNQIALYEAKIADPIASFYTKMKVRFTRDFLKMMKSDPKRKHFGIFSAEDLIKSENENPWTPQNIINHSTALADHNTLKELPRIKHKTLIIAGEKDRLTPRISNEQVHEKLPNSELRIVSGGHYFPLENAPQVNQIIIDFLKS